MSVSVRRGERPNLPYFIALGSNLGDREATLRQAWAMLADLCAAASRYAADSAKLSPLYETRPMYVVDQPLYLNAVGRLSCGIGPMDMLDHLHRIEKALGRDRTKEIRMGPRTLDLDILLCGNLIMDGPTLTIPHPRVTERLFVLVPLLALSPRLRDPRTGIPYADSLAHLQADKEATEAGGVYLYPSG
jgi:2-amino-4-hydroxy-6-hydroxymethyldihydropteridine diphosphokinase